MSIDEYQVYYANVLLELGISLDLPPAEKVERLLAVDTATVPVFIIPVVTMALCDNKVLISGGIPTYPEYNEFKVPTWCPRVMIGGYEIFDRLQEMDLVKDFAGLGCRAVYLEE
jgi:hypothetical protein